jgi:monofunctional biosynthetic peptidoglycan transglycosylase
MAAATVLWALAIVGAGAREADSVGEEVVSDRNAGSLSEFRAGEAAAWRSIDDVVMGGVSSSRLTLTSAGTGVFEGAVSLANNGGFASVRRPVGPLDLSAHPGIELRVRGDGRRYRLRLRPDDRFDGVAWQAGFETLDGEWQVVALPFADFEPSYRGRRPAGAGPIDTRRIAQLGLMIADRQAGPFRLEIDWIRAQPTGR